MAILTNRVSKVHTLTAQCSAYCALFPNFFIFQANEHNGHFALFFQFFCFSSQRAVIWFSGMISDFSIILMQYFLKNWERTLHTWRSAHYTLFFQLFCFLSQRADFWCAGLKEDFIVIHIHYFLTNRMCTVQTHTVNCALFSQLFCFSRQKAVVWCAGKQKCWKNSTQCTLYCVHVHCAPPISV